MTQFTETILKLKNDPTKLEKYVIDILEQAYDSGYADGYHEGYNDCEENIDD